MTYLVAQWVTMRRRGYLNRIDEHMARGNVLMERIRELLHEVSEEVRLTREEVRLSREQHADLRVFIREMTIRGERFTQGVVAELHELTESSRRHREETRREHLDLWEESRAQSQAVLRLLDRLGPEPSTG